MKIGVLILSILGFLNNALSQYNIDTIGLNACLEEFNLQNSFVILGEAHDVAGTSELEVHLIDKFFQYGYSTIIIEGGVSESAILNYYMMTGDESVLNYTHARRPNYKKLITNIREIDENIRFRGVDFERSICLEYLFNSWFKEINTPSLQEMIKKLRLIRRNTSAKKMKKLIVEARADFIKNEQEIERELKGNTPILKQILFNPAFQSDLKLSSIKRDKAILKNILGIENDVLKKSILITGSNHITNEKHFWTNFTTANKTEIKTVLVLFAYNNCTNYLKRGKYSSAKPLSNFTSGSHSTKPEILFETKIDKKISPMSDGNKFIVAKLLNL